MERSGSHRLRLGRRSIVGQLYHVRFATRGRAPLLASLPAGRAVVRALYGAEHRGEAKTLCFVVMPDHVHWLLELGSMAPLSRVVGAAKGRASRALRHCSTGTTEGVWQPGYFDRALRREEDLAAIARYIVANPIRAELVTSVRAWPHWDAIWL
jgi:REP element-mobilizing transposase RayT